MLFRRRPAECPVCAAKDQTILLMADMLDWHRAQIGAHAQSATAVVSPVAEAVPSDERMWYSEAEEEIIAALEDGSMDSEAAERAFALIQAQQTTLH
jgi:hypothetical protein